MAKRVVISVGLYELNNGSTRGGRRGLFRLVGYSSARERLKKEFSQKIKLSLYKTKCEVKFEALYFHQLFLTKKRENKEKRMERDA